MLARPGSMPPEEGFAYEVKWDGFKAIVSTVEGFRVRSRRGWDMTELVPELGGMPTGLVLDGELIASDAARSISLPTLCERLLQGKPGIPIAFVIVDVLHQAGRSFMGQPYWQRRRLLDRLDLQGPHWRTPEVFDHGEALLEAVKLAKLEGIVAKKLSQTYRPGERHWIKVRNRDYWRYPLEREFVARTQSRLASNAKAASGVARR
jgi:bifunctional non-homologous end joining protein LigD